jgi:hypothetical protein
MALRVTPDQAATIALKGLAYLANSDRDLDRFMELTGAARGTLWVRADEPEFLVSLLDFMLANEAVLVDFCQSTCIDARAIYQARHVLSGG